MATNMFACSRQIIYDETLPLEMTAAALELDRLRKGFAELFDRAAQAVQLAGYEQDDAVLERYLIVRTADGTEVTIGAEWLADRERLIGYIVESLHGFPGIDMDFLGVSIIGIRVKAVVE
jgi:hypothetical protein